jgi:hypothetical protein
MGETATVRCPRARDALAHRRDSQQGTDGDDRVGGRDHDGVRRVQHCGRGVRQSRRLGPVEADAGDGDAVAPPDEVLLELDLALTGHGQHGVERVVRDGEEAHRHAVRGGDLPGDLRQRAALGEAVGAVEVGGDVLIAEPEPRAAGSRPGRSDGGEALQRGHHPPGLPGQAPAPLRIDGTGEGVGDGVEVGADGQAVERRVVADVDNSGERARVDDLLQPGEEAGRADPAREHRDHVGAPSIASSR